MIKFTRLRYSVLAAVCAAFLLSTPVSTSAQSPTDPLLIPIVGAVVGGGTFVGNLALQGFRVVDGAVVAIGTLTGTLTSATGVVTSVVRNLLLPVVIPDATCEILHLDLGPTDLNLLGLQVNLNRIVLDVVAEAGPGRLLGNLLCTVAGLLDDAPNRLARVLNSILAILN